MQIDTVDGKRNVQLESKGLCLNCFRTYDPANAKGVTPLHEAVLSGQPEMLRLLLKERFKLWIANEQSN